MTITHKIRLDPNVKQQEMFARHAGLARVAFNEALGDFKASLDRGHWIGWMTLNKLWNSKKREKFPWSCDHHYHSITKHSIKHLDTALRNWRGKKKGGVAAKRKLRFPVFKKKGVRDCFHLDPIAVKFNERGIKLPKALGGSVRMFEALRFTGKLIKVVISRHANRWFVS